MSWTYSLEQAAELAVHQKNSTRNIDPQRWAKTYGVTTEEVRQALEKAQIGAGK